MQLTLVECINYKKQKYRIRWDVQLINDNKTDRLNFKYVDIMHKPSINEVKNIVINGYNETTNKTDKNCKLNSEAVRHIKMNLEMISK